MAVSVTFAFQDYAGATTGVGLPVTFPVLDIGDIYVSKLLVGGTEFINLVPDVDFTRVDLGGGNYEIETTADYASAITIRVYRLTTLTQPASLPEAGPFQAAVVERMADRATMQLQEVYMRAGIDTAGVDLPLGSTFFLPVAVFADNAARAAATPAYLGQPGIQINSGALYYGTSLAPAGWTLIPTGTGSGTVTSVAIDPGTSGLTFAGGPVTTSGTFTVAGTLALANGGTGQTTAQAAINALLAASGALVAGDVFWYNGTNVVRLAASNGVLTNAAGVVSWGSAGTGDVVGPASSVDSRVAMFDATTGKLLKNAAGTNDTAVTIDAGTISDTTSRPLTISQTWNNSGLTATGVLISITSTSSGANSLALQISVSGGDVFSITKTGAVVANSTVTSAGFIFPSSTRITATTDGEVRITNNAASSGLRLKTGTTANTATFRAFDDSNYANIDAASIQARGPFVTPYYEKAALPTPSSWTRGLIWVQDDVGGATIAWCNGVNWLRIRDNVIIS